MTPTRPDWFNYPRLTSVRQRLTTVVAQKPRCPNCNSAELAKYRSIRDQGDGSSLAWVRCTCGLRFKVVLE